MDITTGIYSNISNEEYHARKDYLSASGLQLLSRSAAHFKYSERKVTPSMEIGTALHCAVLEPERFEKEYMATPDIDKRTTKGKSEWEKIATSGIKTMPLNDYLEVCGMEAAILNHELASQLITGGRAEHSIFCEEAVIVDGKPFLMKYKIRPDFIKDCGDYYNLVDVKSTADARPYKFTKAAYEYGYHNQAAFYCDVSALVLDKPVNEFVFIAVENKPPYEVMIYVASKNFMELGRSENSNLIRLYAKCMKENNWPGYGNEVQTLCVPQWAQQRGE